MTFLAATGWSLRNTTWKHAASGMEWHLEKFSFPDYKHKVAHQLREGWRRKQWDALCNGSRRDSIIFRNSTYSEKRVTVVRKVARNSTGPQLAILLGSFYSPAAFSKRRDVPQSMSKCPWCNVEMADQEHIFWNCPSRLTTRVCYWCLILATERHHNQNSPVASALKETRKQILSLKLTWHLKIGHPKRKLVFQPCIFRCYVSFTRVLF